MLRITVEWAGEVQDVITSKVGRPYLLMAVSHLDPQYETYSERWLKQMRAPGFSQAAEEGQAR